MHIRQRPLKESEVALARPYVAIYEAGLVESWLKEVDQTTIPRLVLADVTDFPDDERDAYWQGDSGVLDRYAPTVPGRDQGTITAVVIDLSPACRESWLQSRDMTDEELDRHEARRIAEQDRADRAAQWARRTAPPDGVQEPEMQFDKFGYRISG